MPFPYNTVLITGATSGIGMALTERMITAGVFVIAVGRQKDRLDGLVAKYGPKKVAGETLNISGLDALGDWSKKYVIKLIA
jgi:NADP-dependent 3-hydroxy acid dehydrogenase YdfG